MFDKQDLAMLQKKFESRKEGYKELRKYYTKMAKRGTLIGMYGEEVERADSDLHDVLGNLDLSKKKGRDYLEEILAALWLQIQGYVVFCKAQMEIMGWASFTFDLKAKNALVWGPVGSTKARVKLADLDAESRNCFLGPKTQTAGASEGMAQVFGTTDTGTISVAAFLLFLSNSVHKLRHSLSQQHHDEVEMSVSPHTHDDCFEYNIASFVHARVFGQWRQRFRLTFNTKVQSLFKMMTETAFWDPSTSEMAYYLKLPKGSPGNIRTWHNSTLLQTSASEKLLAPWTRTLLHRRRWLLLFFLNIFKCSWCKKPPRWFIEDLVEPLRSVLNVDAFQLCFHLSEDFLRMSDTVTLQ